MKRLVATTILFGYIALVPFCFFGGMLMANADTMNMMSGAAHQMDDCGMPIGGCTHGAESGGMDATIHHVGMYHSITQTPLIALSLILATLTLVFLVVLGFASNFLSTLFFKNSPQHQIRRVDEPRSKTRQSILTWLSLFETSPNFA